MLFRTEILLPENHPKINHQSSILMIGSCFVDNIGQHLVDCKFNAKINPLGTLYNPQSIADTINILLNKARFTEDNLIFHDQQWLSLYHNTTFSNANQKQCLLNINQAIADAEDYILQAEYLFVTFGTTWVYRHKKSGDVVANCHKLPATDFVREELSVDEIVDTYKSIISKLLVFNPTLKIVFSVSPVRHWKDGAVANMLSKASLIVAVHQLNRLFPQTSYFPGYELMMDDLRDYRFYASDMLHLSEKAIEYIRDKFSVSYFDISTIRLNQEIDKINKSLLHKLPANNPQKNRDFAKQMKDKICYISKEHPRLDFHKELAYFQDLISE